MVHGTQFYGCLRNNTLHVRIPCRVLELATFMMMKQMQYSMSQMYIAANWLQAFSKTTSQGQKRTSTTVSGRTILTPRSYEWIQNHVCFAIQGNNTSTTHAHASTHARPKDGSQCTCSEFWQVARMGPRARYWLVHLPVH